MSDEVALQAFEEAYFGDVETCNASLKGTALARRPELISNFQMEMLSIIIGYSGMLEMQDKADITTAILVAAREFMGVLDVKPKTDLEKRAQRGLHEEKNDLVGK